MGHDAEPTIFELSQPGRHSFQLRTSGIPQLDLDDLIPADHRRSEPVALAEVSERDLVGTLHPTERTAVLGRSRARTRSARAP